MVHSGTFYVEHSTAAFIVIPFNGTNLGKSKEPIRMRITMEKEKNFEVYFDRIEVNETCINGG